MNTRETIIRDDLKMAKLTIAKDRISLKFPKNMSLEERAKIEVFTDNIVETIGQVEFTLRGRFDENGIRLRRKTLLEGDINSNVCFSYQQFDKT